MTDVIQWQRDNPAGSATGATDISGATGSSYTYTVSDTGHRVRARDSGDATVQPSAWSDVITNTNQTGNTFLRGVNLSTFQTMTSAPYSYEMIDSLTSLQFLKSHGVDVVRIPLPWGRFQPTLGAAFETTITPKLQTLVSRCSTAGIKVILDLHCNGGYRSNGGVQGPGAGGERYSASEYNKVFNVPANGDVLGSCGPISSAQFVDFWTRMHALFKNDANVVAYDLVNEPFTSTGPNGDRISQATYRQFQQAAVTALRSAGCTKDIWIEGTNSSQPQGWAAREGNPWITDPLNKIVYSAHTYPTSDTNGNSEYNASDPNTANYLSRLGEFTTWLTAHNQRGSIGETGWPSQSKGAPSTWQQYNNLAEQWLTRADAASLTVTYWQANAAQEEGFDIFTANPPSFTNPTAIISVARTQYNVTRNHPSR